jgi:nucleoside-diphosphate kinase
LLFYQTIHVSSSSFNTSNQFIFILLIILFSQSLFVSRLAGVDDAFLLIYYVKNDGSGEVEIQDPKHKRRFLSRVPYPQLKVEDIRPGGRIMIFSRQYKVEGYEDKATSDALSKSQSGCILILSTSGATSSSSSVTEGLGKVWQSCEAQNLRVVDARMVNISDEDVKLIARDLHAASNANNNNRSKSGGVVSSGPMIVLSVMGEESPQKVQALAYSLSSSSGLPQGCNILFAPDASADARLRGAFFGDIKQQRLQSAVESAGKFSDCACLCVLPSALGNGQAGSILAELQSALSSANLSISALRIANFSRSQAEEFVEVYKAVVPEYVEMINEFSKGPFVAIEVTGNDAVNKLREICGPRDIEVAKRVRQHSLRAKFGISAGASGVHCTDLVEDGPLECEFIFSLISQ